MNRDLLQEAKNIWLLKKSATSKDILNEARHLEESYCPTERNYNV